MKTDSQNENRSENDLMNTPTVEICPNDESCSDGEIRNQQSKIRNVPARPRRTTRRRMRRRGSPNQKCASARRAHRASPFQILPEFAQLSAANLAEVHNVIRDVIVPDAQKFIFQRHGISLSGHCLYRYRNRLFLADQLQVSEDNAPAIQNLLGLLAGKPVDLDQAGIHIIKQRAVDLAANPNSSPSLLKDLFRIFTYNDRLSLQQRRLKCHERMTKVAERRQKFVEIIKKPKKKRSWQQVSRKIVEVIGDLPPVIPYTGPLTPPTSDTPSTPPSQADGPA